MALARLSVLKSYLLLNEAASTYDNALKVLLEQATEIANQFTGRELESASYTLEKYQGNGRDALWLRNYPVTAVSAVKLWDGSAFTTETSTYYELNDSRWLLYPAPLYLSSATFACWPIDSLVRLNIQVSYTAGYVTTLWASAAITDSFAVPRDLEMAVARMAALAWEDGKGGSGRLGVTTMSRVSESLTIDRFVAGLPKDITDVLQSYTRVTL